MISALRKVFRPNARTRRVLSGLCAAFVLATIAFSSIFVSVEADHDCHGQDCPICQEIQTYVGNFQLAGSETSRCDCLLPALFSPVVGTALCAHRAPTTTLQSLDVRFDE